MNKIYTTCAIGLSLVTFSSYGMEGGGDGGSPPRRKRPTPHASDASPSAYSPPTQRTRLFSAGSASARSAAAAAPASPPASGAGAWSPAAGAGRSPGLASSLRQAPTRPQRRTIIACPGAGSDAKTTPWENIGPVLKVLGEGDKARVYLIGPKGHERVLKVLAATVGADARLGDAEGEFQRQQTAAHLGVAPQLTGNLMCIPDFPPPNGETKVVFAFFMEAIPHSASLKDALASFGPLPRNERGEAIVDHERGATLVDLASKTFDALNYLMKAGINYHDLSPGNILVVGNEKGFKTPAAIKIIDFGLAPTDEEGDRNLGNPNYHLDEVYTLDLPTGHHDFFAAVLIYLEAFGQYNTDPARIQRLTQKQLKDHLTHLKSVPGPLNDFAELVLARMHAMGY